MLNIRRVENETTSKKSNTYWRLLEVTFPNKATRYFVKNYTEDDILVSFAANDSEDESFKIKSGIAEDVAISYDGIRGRYEVNKIYVKGTGEVEIQQLDF